MKKLLTLIVLLLSIKANVFAQANTSLSNLINPTSVNQSLIPLSSYTYDLGTTSKGWRNGYFAGSIYLSGVRFLAFPSSGADNTFVGANSGNVNSGDFNVGVGYESLYNNSSGDFNTAVGFESLLTNTSGSNNSAFGLEALWKNTTGYDNTAIGYLSLNGNTSGHNNTSLGYESMYSNTTGYSNAAVGDSALYANSSGHSNAAFGISALKSNTSGYNNIAIGYWPMRSNTTGHADDAIGWHALYKNTTGNENIAIGNHALESNTTAADNTAVGYSALSTNTTGSDNTALGHAADVSSAGLSNATAIGANTIVSASNSLVLGNNVNVGIGTSTPAYKLDVCGTIRAKEVRVESGWCDYVFEKNYSLRSLPDLEKFIQTNKHLPGIPAASDIQQNGLDVAQVQTAMMQKIEELTLYVIELQKEVSQLKSEKNESK